MVPFLADIGGGDSESVPLPFLEMFNWSLLIGLTKIMYK